MSIAWIIACRVARLLEFVSLKNYAFSDGIDWQKLMMLPTAQRAMRAACILVAMLIAMLFMAPGASAYEESRSDLAVAIAQAPDLSLSLGNRNCDLTPRIGLRANQI